jgi:acetylornithine deacetylase/succinyl-diaminopimelate desuccinylase-like protein
MNREDKALEHLDEKEVVEVASALVRIPSLTTREGMGMNDFYQAWFKDLGVPARMYPNGKGTANFFADFGATAFVASPAELDTLVVEQTEKWGKVIRAANIKAE